MAGTQTTTETNSKIKILDTNILMDDPEAIYKFGKDKSDAHTYVCIPITVLGELDNLKKDRDPDRAYDARQAIRVLNSLRKHANNGQQMHASMNDANEIIGGINVNDHYTICTLVEQEASPNPNTERVLSVLRNKYDATIVTLAANLSELHPDVELISNDQSVVNISNGLGINSDNWQDLIQERRVVTGLEKAYKGWVWKEEMPRDIFDVVSQGHEFSFAELELNDLEGKLMPNQFVLVKGHGFPEFALRYDAKERNLHALNYYLEVVREKAGGKKRVTARPGQWFLPKMKVN